MDGIGAMTRLDCWLKNLAGWQLWLLAWAVVLAVLVVAAFLRWILGGAQ